MNDAVERSLGEERVAALREAFPEGGLFAHKDWNYSPEPLAACFALTIKDCSRDLVRAALLG